MYKKKISKKLNDQCNNNNKKIESLEIYNNIL